MSKIRKVVFPVGGLGTRFLPATKSMPKEMLPVVDKPLIHYAFEEAKAAGIEQFIFVTGRNKDAIENHFDRAYELESSLSAKQKDKALAATTDWLPDPGSVVYLRQQEPLGLGHAVWCARHVVGDEPFAVILADDLVHGAKTGCLKQMIEAHASVPAANLAAVMEVPREKTASYGILKLEGGEPPFAPNGATPSLRGSPTATHDSSNAGGVASDPHSRHSRESGNLERHGTRPEIPAYAGMTHQKLVRALGLVEKPQPADAPSTTSIIGRYILQPSIFTALESQARGAGGEIQLTDALSKLIGSTDFYGYRFDGTRYDCGEVVGYIEANVALALGRSELSHALKEKLKKLL